MGKQITRRGIMKACLGAAATCAVGSVSTSAEAIAPALAARGYDTIILGAGTAGLVAAVVFVDDAAKSTALNSTSWQDV